METFIVPVEKETRDRKVETTQKEIVPIFNKRMSQKSVLEYMIENKKASFETER